MGFYLRKSISAGPFRFNLSGSGLGLSVGVKGYRVGTGPRGNYVHMGRDGLYYRASALGRKNYLFAGSDSGGDRAAAMYTIIQTAKLNGLNPEAYLTDTMTKIADGHPINRIDELMPWNSGNARSLPTSPEPQHE